MYMAAGVAGGKAAGTDWDTLVAEHIFGPLGMDSTTTSQDGICRYTQYLPTAPQSIEDTGA